MHENRVTWADTKPSLTEVVFLDTLQLFLFVFLRQPLLRSPILIVPPPPPTVHTADVEKVRGLRRNCKITTSGIENAGDGITRILLGTTDLTLVLALAKNKGHTQPDNENMAYVSSTSLSNSLLFSLSSSEAFFCSSTWWTDVYLKAGTRGSQRLII